jgi:hypothetical protein
LGVRVYLTEAPTPQLLGLCLGRIVRRRASHGRHRGALALAPRAQAAAGASFRIWGFRV